MMNEIPELRWFLIRKVYFIIAVQLFATIVSGFIGATLRYIYFSLEPTIDVIAIYIGSMIYPLLTLFRLYHCHQRNTSNHYCLEIFTCGICFEIALSCASTSNKVIFEAFRFTAMAVVSLTLCTFWASSRGIGFIVLVPFLFGSRLVLIVLVIVFEMILIFFSLGKLSAVILIGLAIIISCLNAILFCGFIVYNTDNLIKRFSLGDYICASVSLYLDIVNLFLALLWLFDVLVFDVFDAD